MELREKQLVERNKYAMIGNVIIAAFAMLGALSSVFYDSVILGVIRILVCAADIGVCIFYYSKMKNQEKYKHVIFLSIAAVYVVTLLFVTAPGAYVILYPIALLLTIYADKKVTVIGASLCSVMLIIFCGRMYGSGAMPFADLFTIWGFVIPSIVIVLGSTALHSRHTKESLEVAGKGMEEAVDVSEKIVRLAENLNDKFESAQEVSKNLNSATNESNTSISGIAENTKSTAQAIEMQSVMTSEIQENIRGAVSRARQMEGVSDRANERVSQGVSLIEQLKAHSAEVEKISTATNLTTQQLNDSIKDVQAITETIYGISNQTNLLALNASIEAARAGEAGKGFAVVADEIRNLSDETREATRRIGEIISKLTEDAELASRNMSESARYAQMQNELISETGDKLSQIKEDTDELRDGVLSVSRSVEEIDGANSKMVESITELSATFQEVASSTETAMSLSDSSMTALSSMNGLLKDISEIAQQMEKVAGR